MSRIAVKHCFHLETEMVISPDETPFLKRGYGLRRKMLTLKQFPYSITGGLERKKNHISVFKSQLLRTEYLNGSYDAINESRPRRFNRTYTSAIPSGVFRNHQRPITR